MMLTATTDLVNLDVGSAAVMALLGYAVVFFGIILLMIVVMIMGMFGDSINELLNLDNPYNCPNGRPTIVSMSQNELEKKFKRIV